MSQHRPVPRLDLAPKLKRPLSLWNPLDYLRLLYWVLFFPQALRWYLDTFGDGSSLDKEMTWLKAWELLRHNQILREFLLQGFVLTVVPLLLILGLFQGMSAEFFLMLGIASLGVLVAPDIVPNVVLKVASNVSLGVALDVVLDAVPKVASGMVLGMVSGVVLGVASGVWGGVLGSVVLGVLVGAVLGVLMGVPKLRPEDWLLGLLLSLHSPRNVCWHIPHVTPLPLYSLSSWLTSSLRQDWETGLHNVNQLLAYTLQFIPVIQAVNQALAETPPEQVIFRVVQLAEAPFDWDVVHFASASVSETLKSKAMDGLSLLPSRWRRQLQERFITEIRLDTPARATATGFWHLHKKELAKAIEAFGVVRYLPYGEEMFVLAQTLAVFCNAQHPATIPAFQLPAFPEKPLLRPATWESLISLRRVVEDVQIVQRSVSRSARAFALARAQGELTNILNNADILPQAERSLIVDIAQTWKEALLQVTGEVGEISITKPVTNPYVVGDPVEGNFFVGREDVLRQLEELWVMGHRLQSVVLYGHRRMGKTSILLNAANCSGSGIKVAYVNLLRLGDSPQGVGEVLMAISDAIFDAVDCTPPSDADLLNIPYRTFERYLKQVKAHLSGGLIVALDEFEKIEELIEAQKIPKDFMGYLRGLVQMSSKVAFAFAGLHTLEEMTADYFQPFFASVIPIHVGFLQPGATRQILANPDEDFPLNYTPEALDQIYALTAGQPYLVQLVGFQLVRRYNDYVFVSEAGTKFQQGRSRNPVFTVEDVEAVINDPEFFKRGRYYFDGVWGQAARGASGQQAILRTLAPYPEGLSIDELRTQLDELVGAQGLAPLQEETLQEALKTLMRHDVVQERKGSWYIIVELFRRWVLP
jgi:hypothetical protein